MKTLVVYDSVYGNTEKIAKAIGGAIPGETRVIRPNEINPEKLERVDLLIVGSPTLGGRPSEPIQKFLEGVPAASVKGVKMGAFDTRYSGRFVKIFGFAAERIAAALEAKGAVPASAPQAFIVKGKTGPLQDGELERALSWARDISK